MIETSTTDGRERERGGRGSRARSHLGEEHGSGEAGEEKEKAGEENGGEAKLGPPQGHQGRPPFVSSHGSGCSSRALLDDDLLGRERKKQRRRKMRENRRAITLGPPRVRGESMARPSFSVF